MTTLVLVCAIATRPADQIERDPYGVPILHAASAIKAFELQGVACSQDRLWQMEMSRRQCEGRLAEVLGPNAERSDRQVLQTAYTKDELMGQFQSLPSEVRAAFEAYAKGVNEDIDKRKADGTLPEGYRQFGFEPEPWTVYDSCSVMVRLTRLFGRGGAGELRNLALLSYLGMQQVKGRELDVLDDLAWQNDPRSPTTVKGDKSGAAHPRIFGEPTRAETIAQWRSEPKPSILELAGAIAAVVQDDSKLMAQRVGAPYKTGSYCIVVPKENSATGNPLLLTAPQMGHATPSIIHEVAFDTPELKVSGMDVPGVPAVAIGTNPHLAWGLTSGVADIEDVFWAPLDGDDSYAYGNKKVPLEKVAFTLKVKGAPDKTVTQVRTQHGPVVLLSRGAKAVFSLQSSIWKHELAMATGIFAVNRAKTPSDIDEAVKDIPATFNLFFATADGHTGYRYVGHVALRNPGLDPRLPTKDIPENQWRGQVPFAAMPAMTDARQGVISNWNNKPAAWWPNGDTPVWGRLFRVDTLRTSLARPKLTAFDLEKAAWDIARKDETDAFFQAAIVRAVAKERGREPATEAERQLAGWDGWSVQGSVGAEIYRECVRQLRRQLFLRSIGNLTSENLFVTALQPSLIANALEGRTKVDYLAGRTKESVLSAAFRDAVEELSSQSGSAVASWRYNVGSMTVPDEAPIPYINRGTYIQVTEFFPAGPSARSVASPGVAESGPHSRDQVPLARSWTFKSVWEWSSRN